MKLILFLFTVVTLFPMAQGAHAEASLKPSPAALGSKITFGDLFREEALPATIAGVAIGPAPRPGRRSAIDATWLETMARRHGILWKKPPGLASIIVSRAGQAVPGEHITATIAEALKAQTSMAGVILTIEPIEIWIPAEAEPSLAVESLDYNQGTGRFTARIRAPAEDGEIFALYGRATPAKPVATLTRDVAPGEILKTADILEQQVEIGRVAQDTLTDATTAVGLSVKRQMRAGQKLRRSDVERPRVLKKGDMVTLVYEVPGMTLTVLGRAMSDGAAGDVIPIVNAQSHRTIEAKVTAAGTAIVEARASLPRRSPILAAGER